MLRVAGGYQARSHGCLLPVDESTHLLDSLRTPTAKPGEVGARQDAEQHVMLVDDTQVLQTRGSEVMESTHHRCLPMRHLRGGLGQAKKRHESAGVRLLLGEQRHELRARHKAHEAPVRIDDGVPCEGRLQQQLDDLLIGLEGPQHNHVCGAYVVRRHPFEDEMVILVEAVLQQVDVRIRLQDDVVHAGAVPVGQVLAPHNDQHERKQQIHVVRDLDEDDR
mmetsp:Transcript_143169/g.356783  ORF Transcript_143169/g.356783 Transcript_143169/m.356783 type:complete len:221 (-) Transcript_143169:2124-2786(-)